MAGEKIWEIGRIFAVKVCDKVLEIVRNFMAEKLHGCVKNVLHLLEP